MTKRLARLVPQGRVVGIDASAFWINWARGRVRNMPNADLRVGTVMSVDLDRGSFDAALFHYVLHEIPTFERAATIERIHDLLADGGRLLVCEPTRPDHGMPPSEIRRLATTAGLIEESCAERRTFFFGPHVEMAFRKR